MIDQTRQESVELPTLEEILDEFDFLGDSEAQIDYLIDLGLELPALPAEAKTEQNRVHGCQSNVWLLTNYAGEDQRLQLKAESDAMIVSGLIVVLLACYHGKTPVEVLETDLVTILNQLGIDRHISPQRKNGLNGMIQRIRESAQQQLTSPGRSPDA